MKFCPVCQNMLYMRIDGDDAHLNMYCKHCSYNEQADARNKKDIIISRMETSDGTADYKQYMTADIKHDPTLPRVNHIKCPNSSCTSTDVTREVIYLKYDPINLKYLYFCTTCETFWTTDGVGA